MSLDVSRAHYNKLGSLGFSQATLMDRERAFWASKSGAVPSASFSFNDHKFRGLAALGFTQPTVDDRELAWLKSLAAGKVHDDLMFDLFVTKAGAGVV